MRYLWVPLLACLLIAAGCDGKKAPEPNVTSSATPAAAPAPAKVPVPDLEYEALTQQQVDLYKSVMKDAAAKRKTITDPADLKALEFDHATFLRIQKEKNPKYHKYTPQEEAWLKRADELHYLDGDIAKAKGQFDLYYQVRQAIEGMIGPRECDESDCGKGIPEDDPKMRKQQLEEDKKRKAIINQDLALLKPQETEILELIKEVRE
jgi:hypothetical protein